MAHDREQNFGLGVFSPHWRHELKVREDVVRVPIISTALLRNSRVKQVTGVSSYD